MQYHSDDEDHPCQDERIEFKEELLGTNEYCPCQTKAANQGIQLSKHEGHTANAFAQRYRSKTPAERVLNSGHLLFKLLDVEFLNNIHAEDALPIRLTQANDSDKKGDAYYGSNH